MCSRVTFSAPEAWTSFNPVWLCYLLLGRKSSCVLACIHSADYIFSPSFSDGTKTLKPRAQTLQVVASAEEGKSVGKGEWEWLPVRTLLATFLAKRCDKLEETIFRKYFKKWVSKSVPVLWGENCFAPELTQTNAFGSDCPAAHCQVQYHCAVHGNCVFFSLFK